jgi:hypothetical protein
VRTVQPVLEDLEPELEEAAGRSARPLCRPSCAWSCRRSPALLTGFALAFARAIGEYGSVIFIAGNMPMVSEIAPLLIITKLEQYDYAGATAIAVVMLLLSFTLLLAINLLQLDSAAGALMSGAMIARPIAETLRDGSLRSGRASADSRARARRTLIGSRSLFLGAFPRAAARGRVLARRWPRASRPSSRRSSRTRMRSRPSS